MIKIPKRVMSSKLNLEVHFSILFHVPITTRQKSKSKFLISKIIFVLTDLDLFISQKTQTRAGQHLRI